MYSKKATEISVKAKLGHISSIFCDSFENIKFNDQIFIENKIILFEAQFLMFKNNISTRKVHLL